LPRFIFFKLIL